MQYTCKSLSQPFPLCLHSFPLFISIYLFSALSSLPYLFPSSVYLRIQMCARSPSRRPRALLVNTVCSTKASRETCHSFFFFFLFFFSSSSSLSFLLLYLFLFPSLQYLSITLSLVALFLDVAERGHDVSIVANGRLGGSPVALVYTYARPSLDPLCTPFNSSPQPPSSHSPHSHRNAVQKRADSRKGYHTPGLTDHFAISAPRSLTREKKRALRFCSCYSGAGI